MRGGSWFGGLWFFGCLWLMFLGLFSVFWGGVLGSAFWCFSGCDVFFGVFLMCFAVFVRWFCLYLMICWSRWKWAIPEKISIVF